MSIKTVWDTIYPVKKVTIGGGYTCCPYENNDDGEDLWMLTILAQNQNKTIGPIRREALRSFMRKGFVDLGDEPHMRYIVPQTFYPAISYAIKLDTTVHVVIFTPKTTFEEYPEYNWQINALQSVGVYVCNDHRKAYVCNAPN